MKNCIYCYAEMPETASYCNTCQHHQNKIRNLIPHLSGLIAAISIFGSGLFYIADKVNGFRWGFDPTQILLTDYASSESLVVRNNSDDDIFLKSIFIDHPEYRSNKMAVLNQEVGRGSVAKFHFRQKPHYVSVFDKRLYDKNVNRKKMGFDFIYLSQNSSSLHQYRSYYPAEPKKLVELPVNCSLRYVNLSDNQEYSKPFDCVAVLADFARKERLEKAAKRKPTQKNGDPS